VLNLQIFKLGRLLLDRPPLIFKGAKIALVGTAVLGAGALISNTVFQNQALTNAFDWALMVLFWLVFICALIVILIPILYVLSTFKNRKQPQSNGA